VVDSRIGQDGIRRLDPHRFFMDQIEQAPYTAEMLCKARLISGPFVVKDWSYVSDRMIGDGYILIGDAACFVDPLFSSGVHLALMSGVLAAAYVTTALKDTSMRSAAGRVYEELYRKEYNHFRELARLFYSSNRTIDSYFWEARRLLETESDDSPRHAFIHAVAGQPPRGYERAVLERGHLPSEFVTSVHVVESERADRRARWAAAAPHSDIRQMTLYHAVPRLAAGVQVQRKPVIAEGEFVRSYVLTASGHPEGVPCSSFVAKMVSLIDGYMSVAELLTRLCGDLDEIQCAQIRLNALTALRILYIDGTVADLHHL